MKKGALEVGLSEDGLEVIINHPDLEPGEDGVGHIVFSPDQAERLAQLLLKHAEGARATARRAHNSEVKP
jgi:hypothetical protein